MGSIYAELIIKGLKTIEDVPDRHKEEVQAILSQSNEG
ncbi:CD1375 family protein [Enterococcus faecium]|nr:CD1375 family protein [Enterococcus faecium]